MICIVATVHDGDTFKCDDGTIIRIAAIEARELSGKCHLAHCANGSGFRARTILMRMIYRQTINCTPLDYSYQRIVARCVLADGSDLRCALIRSGAAVDWPSFARKYRLPACSPN